MDRNESFPALGTTALAVRLGWASVEIMMDDVDEIQVLISGDADDVQELKVCLQEDKLLVEQPSYGLSARLNTARWMQVFIRLPQDWKGAVSASSVSGDVTVRGVSGTDLELDTVSGDVRATGLTGISVSLRSVSGDIVGYDLASDACALRTVSGKIRLTECGFMACKLSAVSGEVSLGLASAFDKVEGVTVSGEVCIIAPIDRVDASLRAVSGRLLTEGVSIAPGGPRVSVSSVSANLKLVCSLITQADNI